MKYTSFGKTGIRVSRLCLGMMSFGNQQAWHLEIEDAKPIVKKALDLGINFFDTADVYSAGRSEEITGELLSDYRDDVVIATKVFFPIEGFTAEASPNRSGLSRYHVFRAIKASLERLKMEYVDLYQIHRLDKSVSPEELMRTLNYLIESGSVLHIGASSMFTWQLAKLQWVADKLGLEPFSSMQNHYNLVYREEEREMIPFCIDQNMAIIPWSPLARGFLTGKYSRGIQPKSVRAKSDPFLEKRYFKDEDFEIVERVKQLSEEKEVSPAQIALAWLFTKSYVTAPVLGATKVEHVEQAVEALDISLSSGDISFLEEPYTPHPIIGHS